MNKTESLNIYIYMYLLTIVNMWNYTESLILYYLTVNYFRLNIVNVYILRLKCV